MYSVTLLERRKAALNKTERQIKAVEKQNTEGKYNTVLQNLRVKERRQRAAVQEAELQIELGLE